MLPQKSFWNKIFIGQQNTSVDSCEKHRVAKQKVWEKNEDWNRARDWPIDIFRRGLC